MKEIVIISGKGGTGKTSITASLAALAAPVVLTDCDVDAADLHLLLQPAPLRREDFYAGVLARIDAELCTACGRCAELCRFDAVSAVDGYGIDETACEGCGVCERFCPAGAVRMEERHCGEWYVSETRFGTMAHARLAPGGENSGKLVTVLRNEARRIAQERGIELIISDGPPGVGCPVIASLAGADLALVVTEPTLAGIHDLRRVAELTAHFRVPTAICVNKYDINPELTEEIERFAAGSDLALLGLVSYDTAFTESQLRGLTVVEGGHGSARGEIERLWKQIRQMPAPAHAARTKQAT